MNNLWPKSRPWITSNSHCSTAKDRTGLVALVALACLGMTHWAPITPAIRKASRRGRRDRPQSQGEPLARNGAEDFLPLVAADSELARVLTKVDQKKFEWSVEMSQKLYQAQFRPSSPS